MAAQDGAGASERALSLLARALSGAVHGRMHAAHTHVAPTRCISADKTTLLAAQRPGPAAKWIAQQGTRALGHAAFKEAMRDAGCGTRETARAAWTCGVTIHLGRSASFTRGPPKKHRGSPPPLWACARARHVTGAHKSEAMAETRAQPAARGPAWRLIAEWQPPPSPRGSVAANTQPLSRQSDASPALGGAGARGGGERVQDRATPVRCAAGNPAGRLSLTGRGVDMRRLSTGHPTRNHAHR